MISGIEMRDVRVFLTLADELHFGRTAERLQLTHSRVSQTIRVLETRLGGRLFERNSRNVRLTSLGQELRERVAPAYEQLQQGLLDARESATGAGGLLRLGLYALPAGGELLMEIVRTFEARHPQCEVRITETGLSRNQYDWLRSRDLDVLVMRAPVEGSDLESGATLTREERVLAVASDHPLAARRSVSVEDFADYTTTDVAVGPREVMDVFSPPRTPSGRQIRRVPVASVSEAALRVATGELIHPTVPAFFTAYPHPQVSAVPIRDLPLTTTHLVWLCSNRSSQIARFVAVAEEISSDV